MEEYSIGNGFVTIQDAELGIDIKAPWTIPILPEDPQNGELLSDGAKVFVYNYMDSSKVVVSSEKEGVFHGEWRYVYPNGNIKIKAFYDRGRLHGPFRFYSEEGILLVDNWFIDGMKEGRAKSFYLQGQKSSEERFYHDQPHGIQRYWFGDGTLKTSMVYNRGVLEGKVDLYYPNGKLFRSLEF